MIGVRPIQGTGLYTSVSFENRERPKTSDSFFPSTSSRSNPYLTLQTIWGDEAPKRPTTSGFQRTAKSRRKRGKRRGKGNEKKQQAATLFPCISYQEDNEG